MKIKLIKSSFHNEAETKKKLVSFIEKAEILSFNGECQKFEKAFAAKQGRKYGVFVTSGSSANLVLVQALLNLGRLKRGDVVGTSALTWSTNMMPIIQLGLESFAIDVSKETLNNTPEEIEKAASEIQCLFITNVLGFADDIGRIAEICKQKNIILLEDNCESLGSRTAGKLLGNFSLASTFSFFVGHHMSTIEGGMICTDDKELHEMLTMVRAHGWDRHLEEEARNAARAKHDVDPFYGNYTFYCLAFNARPTEIAGFLGNEQIQYWDEIVEKRAKNYSQFLEAVKNNKELITPRVEHMDLISNFAMPVVSREEGGIEKYKKRFKDAGVEIRPVLAGNMTLQPFYKAHVKTCCACPNAEWIHRNGFYFPNNPELTLDEVNLLASLLKA